MENNKSLTEISELGEFKLIEELTKEFGIKSELVKIGIGDDAAVIDGIPKKLTLISTDILTEGVHFDPMYFPLKHLGYKSVSVNVSDICAMNGKANFISVSIAVSSKYSVEALKELYDGIKSACDHYNVDLIGGDMTSSAYGLTICISVYGDTDKDKEVLRSGAEENDLLVVSGDLGSAYLGLQILEREKEVFKTNPSIQPDLDGYDYLIQRQLKPEARTDVVEMLRELNIVPTSMIDISDGLASEILHLSKSSDVAMHLYLDKLPLDHKAIDAAEEFNLDPYTVALNGGEDYELLFTINQKDHQLISSNPNFSIIGHTVNKEKGNYIIDNNGSASKLVAQGWKHFN